MRVCVPDKEVFDLCSVREEAYAGVRREFLGSDSHHYTNFIPEEIHVFGLLQYE